MADTPFSDGWMPIETAPKDGTQVLLFTDTRAAPASEAWYYMGIEPFSAVQIGYWEDTVDAPLRQEGAGWRKQLVGEPTHWMPLPAPPERGK